MALSERTAYVEQFFDYIMPEGQQDFPAVKRERKQQ